MLIHQTHLQSYLVYRMFMQTPYYYYYNSTVSNVDSRHNSEGILFTDRMVNCLGYTKSATEQEIYALPIAIVLLEVGFQIVTIHTFHAEITAFGPVLV